MSEFQVNQVNNGCTLQLTVGNQSPIWLLPLLLHCSITNHHAVTSMGNWSIYYRLSTYSIWRHDKKPGFTEQLSEVIFNAGSKIRFTYSHIYGNILYFCYILTLYMLVCGNTQQRWARVLQGKYPRLWNINFTTRRNKNNYFFHFPLDFFFIPCVQLINH